MRQLIFPVMLLAALAACAASPEPQRPAANAAGVVRAFVAAWDARDSAAFDTLMTPDAHYDDIAENFHGVNPGQVKGFMHDLLIGQPDYRWTITRSFEDSGHVAAEWTWTSTYTGPSPDGPVKNLRLTGRGVSIVDVVNGKIVRFTDYYDNASFFPPVAAAKTP